jgi:cysteine desulfurase
MNAIYLDHAATTPVRPEVLEAMLPFYTERFGNPSSAHAFGRQARAALEDARERVALVLGARRGEIVFTSGGTESDNLAVLGRARWGIRTGATTVACSAIEHKAVLSATKQAATEGATPLIVGVDTEARVDLDAVNQALAQRPAVLSVMWVNNEVGAIQPIEQIADLCARARVVLHTDAVQAFGRIPVSVREGIGLLTISGHKLGAPKGIGALYVRTGVELIASQHGGSQEHGVRPGTENIVSAIGLATAVELAAREREAEAARLRGLRDTLEQALLRAIPDLVVNGRGAERVAHILNLSVPHVDQDALLVSLDLAGIAVSTASACQSGAAEPSHVLVAMGKIMNDAAVLRVSLGRRTTSEEIARAADVIPNVVNRVRSVTV